MMTVGNKHVLPIKKVCEGKRNRGVVHGPEPVPDLVEFNINIGFAPHF